MTFAIVGLGTALPRYWVEQAEAARFAERLLDHPAGSARLLASLYRRSGVGRRHTVVLDEPPVSGMTSTGEADHADSLVDRQQLFYRAEDLADEGPTTARRMEYYEAHAGPLAVSAARRALIDGGVDAGEVTHLITVSCTGFAAPGIDLRLINELALSPAVLRTHVGFMGCHGAVNALRVAAAFAAADPAATILIAAVELCSLHHQYGWHPERIVANALFGDGAAAVVGRNRCRVAQDRWRLRNTAAQVLEQADDLMSWRVRDHGFVMGLSPQVPQVIASRLRPWIESWLAREDLTLADVRSWIIHPGGPRILRAVAATLGLNESAVKASWDILKRCGNMSSPTVLFILEELRRQQASMPCAMLAFGPGLALEAALWE